METYLQAGDSCLNIITYKGRRFDPRSGLHIGLPKHGEITAEDFAKLFSVNGRSAPAFGFPAFEHWFDRLLANLDLQQDEAHPFHKHPYKLRGIDVQAVDWFRKDKLGFMKLQADIKTDPYVHDEEDMARGDWLPGTVFLRGGSVAVLIIVQPEDAQEEDQKHAILTVQPRIAVGSLAFTEIPAGMLDGGTLKGTAASEIEEEAKLKVKESDLLNLSELALEDVPATPWTANQNNAIPPGSESIENSMYPSVGACDEFIPILLCQKRLTRRHMNWLKGKATGLRDEGENITLKLVPLTRVWREAGRDAKALAAITLYDNLKREGRIPNMPEEIEAEPIGLE